MMTGSTANAESHHTTPRLFVTSELREGNEVVASAEHAHYLGSVLRRAPGDVVRLFNGLDGEWAARIAYTNRGQRSHGASLVVGQQLRRQQPETGPWLLFALLKRDATDLVVRQAVELGASRLLPVVTERTNAARVNESRLRAKAVEAAEQSERLTVPVIDPLARLETVLTNWPSERRLFVALERSWPGTLSIAPVPGLAGGEMALLVGPEGGFTRSEHEHLRRLPFVTPLSLGPFVLRADTAAAVGQALLLGMGWAEYVPST